MPLSRWIRLKMTDVENSPIHSANGEFGWDGWSGTYFCVHPESGITVLYFTQLYHGCTTKQAMDIVNTVFTILIYVKHDSK